MSGLDDVAIFWDYENCPVPSNASGYSIVENIRLLSQPYGSVKSFKAYLEISDQVQKSLLLRSELQSSGVSLVDCPHNGRKDVADKMIIVDIFAHAIDNRAPTTILLITGDRDFAYAISILRLRRYRIVLVTLSNAHASLTTQASICLDWATHVLVPAEASLRVSSHSKQGSLSKSVQEKQRHSSSPTNQAESAEVDRGDDLGVLQAIHDPTEKRLAARTVTGQTSFPSNPPSTKSSSIISGSTSVTDKGVKGEGMASAISAGQNTFNAFKPCSSNNAKPLGHPSGIVEDPPFSADDVDMYLQHHHRQYASRNKSSSNSVETFPSFTTSVPRILIRPDPNFIHSKPPLQAPLVSTPHTADKLHVLPQPPSRPFANVASIPSQPSSSPKDAASNPFVVPSDNVTQIPAPVIKETSSPRSTLSQLQALPSISPRGPISSVDSPPAVPPGSTSSVSYENSSRANPYTPYASRPIDQPQPTPVYPGKGKPLSGGVAISPRTSTSTTRTSSVEPSVQHVLSSSDPDSPRVAAQSVDNDPTAITATLSRQEVVVPSPEMDQTLPPSEPESRLSPITILSSLSLQPGPFSLGASEGLSEHPSAASTRLRDKPLGGSATPVPPRKVVPEVFKILVQTLQAHMKRGNLRPLRTNIAIEISKNGATYTRAGVTRFGQYVALAVGQGIVELGGWQGEAWISLNTDWYDAVTSVTHGVVPMSSSPSTGPSSSVSATPSSIVLTNPSPTPALVASTSTPILASPSSSSGPLYLNIVKTPPRAPAPDAPSISAVVCEAAAVAEDLDSSVQTEPLSTATAPPAGTPTSPVSATSQSHEISSNGLGNHAMPDKSSTSEDSGHVDDAPPVLPVTVAEHEPTIPTVLPASTSGHLVNPAEVLSSTKTPLESPPMPAAECEDPGIISTSPPNPSESSTPIENPENATCRTSHLAATPGPSTPSQVLEIPLTPRTAQPTLVQEATFSAQTPFAASLPILSTPELQAIPVVPAIFRDLVNCLQEHRSEGTERLNQSIVATYLYDKGPVYVYKNAGVRTFAQYAALAEKKGIVTLGGNGEAAWISLKPDWLMTNAKASSNSLGKSPVSVKKLDKCPQHVDIDPQADMPVVEPQTEAPVAKTAHPESQLSDSVEATHRSNIDIVSNPPTSTSEVSTSSRVSPSSIAGSAESISADTGPSSSVSPCATGEKDLPTANTIMSDITIVAQSSVARPPSSVSQPQHNPPVVPENFNMLVECLQRQRTKGFERPLRSVVSYQLYKDGTAYKKAGVEGFSQYAAMAEKKGIIELGGSDGKAWISLKPEWCSASVYSDEPRPVEISADPAPSSNMSALPCPDSLAPPAIPSAPILSTGDIKPLHPVSLVPSPAQHVATNPSPALPTIVHDISPTSLPPPMPPQYSSQIVPETFKILVERLQAYKSHGTHQPLRSTIALEISKNGSTYKNAGVDTFAEYAALARKKGLIELGGSGGKAWISLKMDLPTRPSSPSQRQAPATVPEIFKILVEGLQFYRSKGNYCPTWSVLSQQICKKGTTYEKAGVSRFKEYITLAKERGIIEYGAVGTDGWVRLKPKWHDVVLP